MPLTPTWMMAPSSGSKAMPPKARTAKVMVSSRKIVDGLGVPSGENSTTTMSLATAAAGTEPGVIVSPAMPQTAPSELAARSFTQASAEDAAGRSVSCPVVRSIVARSQVSSPLSMIV